MSPPNRNDMERSIRLAMEQALRLGDHQTVGELEAILQLVERGHPAHPVYLADAPLSLARPN